MGSINKSHNEMDGNIILFNGELILLYCDSVHCEIGGKESIKGRVYITTHRLVVLAHPYKPNSPVKSFCAPFCAITKCSVEQPVFSANYIEATVRDENDSSKSFSFKLKFQKGGAIELALTMNRAVAMISRSYNPSMPPPTYNPSPSAQYYQAPPTVYAPGYNCGVQMPVQQFPDQPPIGFIYASSAPPPYPGLGGQVGQVGQGGQGGSQQPNPYGQSQGYPANQPGYPTEQGGQSGPYQSQYPVYPQGPTSGYPNQSATSGYPQQPPAPGYQQQQQTTSGSGYPQQPTGAGYPQQPSSSSGVYPQLPPDGALPQMGQPAGGHTNPGNDTSSQSNQSSWPSAPAFNPNWSDDKKQQ